jgi:predicted enzyme related to lactoylglutathione lyase
VPPIRMTFDVSDRDLAFERIQSMGIREYEPEFQGPYGPVFTVLDPDNNLINLLCPKTAPEWRN